MEYHKQHLSAQPARLKRFVHDMDPQFACKFDPVANLLRINGEFYLRLNKRQQERVWRSAGDVTIHEARKA